MLTWVIGSVNYTFCVMTYCAVVRRFNNFGNTCTSGSLYIETLRY